MTAFTKAFLLASLSSVAVATAAGAQSTNQTSPAAQDATGATQANDQRPAGDQTIIVTGTRTANRTVANSPVPVDVIGSDAIIHTGQTETNRILNQLVPSFNFPQPSIADGSDSLRPATLRGLAPDQTLVLVNGKRRHVAALLNINGTIGRGSAAVDLNLIPGIAISRVEVLRDGAAAQYGSDAIAGVINIQLKSANHGGRASLTYGEYWTTLKDVANVTSLQSSAGQPVLDTDPRYFLANTNGDRTAHDGTQATLAANLGLPLGSRGFVNVSGEVRVRDRTNRAGYDLRPNFNRVGTGPFDSRELTFNRLQFRFGDPDTTDYTLFVNSGYDITPDWQLYAFGSYGHRNATSAANWRQQSATANRDFSTLTPATAPTSANFVPLTDIGFLPLIATKLRDYSAIGGLRGKLAGFKADFSIGRGFDKFDYDVNNTLNTSYGPASPRNFDAGGLRYGQWLVNADFSQDFSVGFAKPLTLAFGAEHRRERFQIRPGQLESYAVGPLFRAAFATTSANCATQGGVYDTTTGVCSFPGRQAPAGAQGFPGIPASSATDAKRHSWAAYAEVDTDPLPNVTTTIAGRFEHFSDFGSTVNGKFAARWEFIPHYAIRGAISNGFRAPSLHQQYFTTTSTNFIGGVPVDIATLSVGAPAAVALGAKPLKPEKSVNLSFGATANPFRGLTLTADYYHIKIKDRIVLTETLGNGGTGNTATVQSQVTTLLQTLGFPTVAAARFFVNGIDTTTKGIDLVGAYNWRMGDFGKWTVTAAYNRNKTSIDKRLAAPGALAQIPNIVLFGRVEGLRFTEGQPKDKIVLSADGDLGPVGITARTTRYGRVVSPGSANPISDPTSLTAFGPDDIFLGRKWVTDAEIRWKPGKGGKGVEFALGANNLFDVYPDRSPFGLRPASVTGSYPANQEYIPYSIFSPFGFNGRFVYARVSADF
ncbi:TonB-dependent receptor [Sphingomonas sp. KRR8]|uniref:TonB-dependent receptor plug domain-containing protein n=1 Tax=Sphingomonas sp. KRR8 TaxID=2942996 RepID=UPI002021D69C|nr:TonB-dependent receptor [Sphingomonas sp. KRR8]URD60694.1 TonB-dependent receptor [Sphingomonas sp. KRR8]